MNLTDAQNSTGRRVLYRPPGGLNGQTPGDRHYGTITSSNSLYVFVRYDDQPTDAPGRATYAQDLTLLYPHPEGTHHQ